MKEVYIHKAINIVFLLKLFVFCASSIVAIFADVDHAYAWNEDAQVCLDKKDDLNLVIAACTRALDSGGLTSDEQAHTYQNRGGAFYDIGQYDKALSDQNEALRRNPNLPNAYIGRGSVYLAKGRHDDAIKEFDKAISIAPSLAWAYAARGNAFTHKGDLDQGVRDFNEAIRLEPTLAWPYAARGNLYSSKGEYASAIEDYNQALLLQPDLAWAYGSRGYGYSFAGNFDKALDDYNAAIRLDPKLAWAFSGRAYVLIQKGEYKKAIADCNEALRLQNDLADAYITRSLAYVEIGTYGKAIADANQAISLQPSLNRAYIARAYARVEEGSFGEAIKDYTEAIRLQPTFAWAYAGRSYAYTQIAQYDRALEDANEALDLQSDLFPAYTTRSLAYARKGQSDKALADADKSVQLQPNNALGYNARGIAYESAGNFDPAIAAFTEALRFRPSYAWAFHNRGDAFESKGLVDKAKDDYRRALDINPNLSFSIDALQRLEPNFVARSRPLEDHKNQLMREIQQHLNALGFNAGAIDGQVGRLTLDAIREFRKIYNLRQSTDLNEKILNVELQKALAGEIKPKSVEEAEVATRDQSTLDVQGPKIIVSEKIETTTARPQIEGRVFDNGNVSSLLLDGEEIPFRAKGDGSFSATVYATLGVNNFEITAFDDAGNLTNAEVTIIRSPPKKVMPYAKLDPFNQKGKTQPDALMISIGIEKYAKISPASYAARDARIFYDFAVNTMGIDEDNIKLMVDEAATEGNIFGEIERFVESRTIKDQTDIFIFFSGHGLASNDGASLYLLPHDADPKILRRTAVNRQELIDVLAKSEARSITFFLDTCYSGLSRNGELLQPAMRGMKVVPKLQIPKKVTVLSSTTGNNIASSLDDAGHGLFSYFLMRGLEGKADYDGNQELTLKELYAYVDSEIPRHAARLGREQRPQLDGNADFVVARW